VEETVARLTSQQQAELQEVRRWTEKAAAAAVEIEVAGGNVPASAPAPAEPSAVEQPAEATPGVTAAERPRVPSRASAPASAASQTAQTAQREYLTARRMTEAAALKANATTRRLTGTESIDPKKLEALRPGL
jgi:hypothetical protein